jgi:hypothetical protein
MSVVTFPLSLAGFFDLLPIRSAAVECPENSVTSITGAGEVIRATLAPQLWRGSVELAPRYHGEAAKIAALLDLLQRPGASFLAYDPRLKFPQADPAGTTLGSANVRVHSVNADRRRLALNGLPAGYVLTRGDYLAFTYGSPAKYALHRVVAATVTASSGLIPGITGEFEVTPPIRAGAAASDSVSLAKPACKAVLLPGSLSTGAGQRRITSGASFQWVQTLK